MCSFDSLGRRKHGKTRNIHLPPRMHLLISLTILKLCSFRFLLHTGFSSLYCSSRYPFVFSFRSFARSSRLLSRSFISSEFNLTQSFIILIVLCTNFFRFKVICGKGLIFQLIKIWGFLIFLLYSSFLIKFLNPIVHFFENMKEHE